MRRLVLVVLLCLFTVNAFAKREWIVCKVMKDAPMYSRLSDVPDGPIDWAKAEQLVKKGKAKILHKGDIVTAEEPDDSRMRVKDNGKYYYIQDIALWPLAETLPARVESCSHDNQTLLVIVSRYIEGVTIKINGKYTWKGSLGTPSNPIPLSWFIMSDGKRFNSNEYAVTSIRIESHGEELFRGN